MAGMTTAQALAAEIDALENGPSTLEAARRRLAGLGRVLERVVELEGRGFEYRVRWQREGLAKRSAIFQTEAGAREKAERLEELEETKLYADETGASRFADMPDLVGPPKIDRRRVGAWEENA